MNLYQVTDKYISLVGHSPIKYETINMRPVDMAECVLKAVIIKTQLIKHDPDGAEF